MMAKKGKKKMKRAGAGKADAPSLKSTQSANTVPRMIRPAVTEARAGNRALNVSFSTAVHPVHGTGLRLHCKIGIGYVYSALATSACFVKAANTSSANVWLLNPGSNAEMIPVLAQIARSFRRYRYASDVTLSYSPAHSVADTTAVVHGGIMVGYVSDTAWAADFDAATVSSRYVALNSMAQTTEFPTSLPAVCKFKVSTETYYRDLQGTATTADYRMEHAGSFLFNWAGGVQPSTTAVYYGDLFAEFVVDLFEFSNYFGTALQQKAVMSEFFGDLRTGRCTVQDEQKYISPHVPMRRETQERKESCPQQQTATPELVLVSAPPTPAAAAPPVRVDKPASVERVQPTWFGR